ncbi:SDR family NAD(P)-dependent oxidoreductase [Pseudalkalibacillus sp. Hm43]|uniref:SDR family NAD(P)-dependent oxidoreductase n=1 Tax=Pseudalkalibacillus sp. Hm43 TaxID=3450742 RepID=UPI003F42A3EC
MNIENQVVVITGSTKGIGRSMAELLARRGATVVINGRDQERIANTVTELKKIHDRIHGICASVSDEESCKRIIDETVDKFGRIDVLVNNAGVVRDRISYKMTEQEWNEVIETHLRGTYACTKHAVLAMREKDEGGTIVNMTSKSGMEGLPGQLNYSAAKSGINGMTYTLAKELERFGISVYAIAPVAETEMTKPVIDMLQKKADEKGVPLPDEWKMGSPDDVAKLLSVILEQQPETGTIYSVNGHKIGRWLPPKHEMITGESDDLTNQAIFRAFSK